VATVAGSSSGALKAASLCAPLRLSPAGPQLIFLAVFEHHGYPKEARPRLTKLLRRRHFLVREMVADFDRKIGLKWLARETWILTIFQWLSGAALKFPLFSHRDRPWMPPLCPGFGHQSTERASGNNFRCLAPIYPSGGLGHGLVHSAL
jgi:hypothetical protein